MSNQLKVVFVNTFFFTKLSGQTEKRNDKNKNKIQTHKKKKEKI